ncbi:dehydrogenase-like protein [Leishmania tarentolae]|uniref:Dehydrogenase-like protein n=1 Tax=Leishmania tarentolae TaxID=5689 RepID=A0A640KNF0_LEITA|nr:dehydrogenase-like protein [Leishmania tarentolae]
MSAIKRSLNVGVVGMGNMGIPITRNLAFKARSAMYLQIHSRTLSKARQVCDDMSADGATCAMRIHDRYSTMTKWCDVILLTLAHRAASRKVLLEDSEALVTNARPGQIIVDHTTVDMELSRECAYEAERRGAVFLDAPMSGSPKQAFNNQLVLMVGGPAEQVQRVSPIFRMYADSIHHMGANGSGTAAKLLSQALVASHNAAAAEAMTIANRLGIEDYQKLIQVLDASWGSSTMLRRNAPTMQNLVRNPDKLAPSSGASIDNLLEDLALLDASLPKIEKRGNGNEKLEVEEERFPVLDASLRMLGAAAESGMGDRDMAAVIHYIPAAAAMEEEDEGDLRPASRAHVRCFS